MIAPTPGDSPDRTVLVAGVGNIFLTDDGFGPEVARRLAGRDLPPGVHAIDYGIRGTHLAFDLLDGSCSALVVVDAIPSRGAPGTVHLIEIGTSDLPGVGLDAHGMDPASMLAGVTAMGGALPPTYLIGCEAQTVEEGIGLTAPVEDAVEDACAAVQALAQRLVRHDAVGHRVGAG